MRIIPPCLSSRLKDSFFPLYRDSSLLLGAKFNPVRIGGSERMKLTPTTIKIIPGRFRGKMTW